MLQEQQAETFKLQTKTETTDKTHIHKEHEN